MKKIYYSPKATIYKIEEEYDVLAGSDDPDNPEFDEELIGSNNNQWEDETGDDDGR